MPTHEAIVSTHLPKEVEKPIPVRTVQTRSVKKEAPSTNLDQTSTLETPVAAEPAEPAAESVRLSPQLSALARKEQAFRQKEQALKAREKELEAKLAQAEEFNQLKTKTSSKDYSEMERLGLDYTEYTQYLLDKQAGVDPQADRVKALEAKIEAQEKRIEESAKLEFEETVAAYDKEIKKLIATSPEFPRTKKAKKEDAVLQLILDSWEEDGDEVTIEDASKYVELHLAELAQELTLDPPKEEERKLPPPRVGSRTLNQNLAAVGTAPQLQKSLQHLPENERYAEAMRRVRARREQGK